MTLYVLFSANPSMTLSCSGSFSKSPHAAGPRNWSLPTGPSCSSLSCTGSTSLSQSLQSSAGSCRLCLPRALHLTPVGLVGRAWSMSPRLPHARRGLLPADRLSLGSGDAASLSQIFSEDCVTVLGPKVSSKPCACRPVYGLLGLDGSPAFHTRGEKPESSFHLVWHAPCPRRSRGLTAQRQAIAGHGCPRAPGPEEASV